MISTKLFPAANWYVGLDVDPAYAKYGYLEYWIEATDRDAAISLAYEACPNPGAELNEAFPAKDHIAFSSESCQ